MRHQLDHLSDRDILIRLYIRIHDMAENEDRIAADADQLSTLLTSTLADAQTTRDALVAAQAQVATLTAAAAAAGVNTDNDVDLAPSVAKLDAMIAKLTPAAPAATDSTSTDTSSSAAPAATDGTASVGDSASATGSTAAAPADTAPPTDGSLATS